MKLVKIKNNPSFIEKAEADFHIKHTEKYGENIRDFEIALRDIVTWKTKKELLGYSHYREFGKYWREVWS